MKYGANDRVQTIMTVHNLAFQGYFGWEIFHQLYLPDQAAIGGARVLWRHRLPQGRA